MWMGSPQGERELCASFLARIHVKISTRLLTPSQQQLVKTNETKMNNENHVIIIGAGIAGLSAAYYLSKAGVDVTVLDKGEGENNCSYGNAGMVVPSHIIPLASPGVISQGLKWMLEAESPFYIRPRLNTELIRWGWEFKKASTRKHVEESVPVLRDLLLANRELLIALEEEEHLDFGFRKNGLFMLCSTEQGLEEEARVADKANSVGIPAEVLTAGEIRTREPNIEMNIIGGVYFPKDAHFHPGSLMDQLKALLRKRGVGFEFNTEVTGLDRNGRKVNGVVTSGGKVIKGSEVVICTGAWSASLARAMGLSLPMQAGKGYSITIPEPRSLPQICALLAEAKVSMTPMMGQMRFGGTMEIAGTDTTINQIKLNALKKSVCSYFPEYSMDDFNGHDAWVGLRPVSPDGLPYVGAVERYDNLYVSTGHSMMGMSLGLASGNIISELITGGNPELAHPMIDPNRYD